jgi:hypothetical protein
MTVARVADFNVLWFSNVVCIVVKLIQRPPADIASGPLKCLDCGDEMVGDEHELEIECPRDVEDRRKA